MRQLARHLLDQHVDACFADGVGADLRPRDFGDPARGHDDAPLYPLGDHAAGGRLADVEAAGQVDIEVPLPILGADFEEGLGVDDAGVGADDVELGQAGDGLVDGGAVADIDHCVFDTRVMRPDALNGGGRVHLREDIPDDDVGAVLRQVARHSVAEVASSAGHDCGFAF